jgi:hypothetical protein
MKSHITKKIKKNMKGGVPIIGNINEKVINFTADTFLKKTLEAKGLNSIEAEETAQKILMNPEIRNKIDTIVEKANKLEGKLEGQGRHDLLGALPFEIGEGLNLFVDSTEDAYSSVKQLKRTYDVEKQLEQQIRNIPGLNSDISASGVSLSTLSAIANKAKGKATAVANKAKRKAKGKKGGTKKKHKKNKKTHKYRKKSSKKH